MTTGVEHLRSRTTSLRVDVIRFLPACVLAGYGILILSLYFRGVMTLYINPTYVWPTTLAGAVLLGIGGLKLVRAGREAVGACDADCGCETPSARIWPYLALSIPLLLGALLPPRSLASFSANQRGLQIAGFTSIHGASTAHRVSLSVDTSTFSLQDWVGALSADPNPRDYLGKPIILTGLVVHSSASVPPGYIMVLRYQVTCCIADARPEGLIVRDTSHGALKDNQWVTVHGVMGQASYQGDKLPVVEPKKIEPTKAGNPYMY